MPRPKKPADKARATIIRVRVTLAEKEKLVALAKKENGLSISDFIRVTAIGAKPLLRATNPMQEVLLRLLASHGKSGSLLNQLTRAIHRRNDNNDYELPLMDLANVLNEFKAISQEIREALKQC